MAEKEEKSNKIEIKIPVFSVLKNGCVQKNIFLSGPGGEIREEYEDMPILIGRHPDCHVTLDHPSISRFHLEIIAKPSVQKISVVDRSSVHGTWVSGIKIEPNMRVDLKEGDVLRLGASTREYRLQWIPLNKAYEIADPLPPLIEEKEENNQEEIFQETLTDKDELISPKLEKVHQSPVRLADTGLISGPPPPALECSEAVKRGTASSLLLDSSGTAPTSELAPPASESVRSIWRETPSSLLSRRSKSKSISFLSIQTGVTKEKAHQEELSRALFENSGANEAELENEESFISDKENMTCTTSEPKQQTASTLNSSSKLHRQVLAEGSLPINSREMLSEAKENHSGASTKEKVTQKFSASRSLKKSGKSVCILGETKQGGESTLKVVHQNENSSSVKENITLQVSFSKNAKKSGEIVHVLERDGVSGPEVLFENCGENEHFASDKENVSPNFLSSRSKYRQVSKSPGKAVLFRDVDFGVDEEENCENFASDKENCTPDSKLAQILRQPFGEARTIIEIGERKETERAPFGVLFDSVCNSPLRPLCTIPDNSSACAAQNLVQRVEHRERRKEWIMVVDTESLLREESVKAIRLLQGLKGTHLIIPRIVIRELDCMKRREGLFRQPNKQASAVLKWIEECMEREPQWIHVQSSSETIPVAPTPPVTPTSLFGDAGADLGPSFGFNLNTIFSPSSFVEILTPTSEDHVLDCALLFKKLRGDAEVVLLSSSTTLKIKAMAEGLLCEEAKEFKDSLTNPCSKRFMWAFSCPRGPTWSCTADVAALAGTYNRKNNNPAIARRAFRATKAIKGLRLILLNSHYGQTSLVN